MLMALVCSITSSLARFFNMLSDYFLKISIRILLKHGPYTKEELLEDTESEIIKEFLNV